jgi:hypothetical protein
MKNHKFQQIRLRISEAGQSVRFNAESDKNYKRIRGIHVSMPDKKAVTGTMLGLKVNNIEVLDDSHEVKLLTCGDAVAPNQMFFLFEDKIEAGGVMMDGRYTDGGLYPMLYDNNNDPNGVIDPTRSASRPNGGTTGVNIPQNPNGVTYPYDVRIVLWLTNLD